MAKESLRNGRPADAQDASYGKTVECCSTPRKGNLTCRRQRQRYFPKERRPLRGRGKLRDLRLSGRNVKEPPRQEFCPYFPKGNKRGDLPKAMSGEEAKLRDLGEAQCHPLLGTLRPRRSSARRRSRCGLRGTVWGVKLSASPSLYTAPPGKGKVVERCSTPRKGNQFPLTPSLAAAQPA